MPSAPRMRVAVAWNGKDDRRVYEQGLPNMETFSEGTVDRVRDALEGAGHEVRVFPGDLDLAHNLEGWLGREDLVFNVSYGVQGAYRYTHVPGLLEMAGFRYTGSDPLAHAVCLEKPLTKMVLRAHGLPVAPGFVVHTDAARVTDRGLGYPLVVKPCRESASLGLAVVEDEEELDAAVAHVHDLFGQAALVERYVDGTDVMVPVLGNHDPQVLPILESRVRGARRPMLTEAEKNGRGQPLETRCPAPLPVALRRRAREIALSAFRALGCRDWCRIDMRLSPVDGLQVLEVNTLPGLGSTSSFPMSAAAAGIPFPALVNRILDTAAARYERKPTPLVQVEAMR